ncbi:MAG: PKD domain-containing protein, partial [Candidatus Gracilibacteria bacterium]|nr:PKD domain-containing protein [Candidatus Gracilibacteria bacterium]
VNYGTGVFNISAKIYDKTNYLNFKTGSLFFYNGVNIYDLIIPDTGSGLQNGGNDGGEDEFNSGGLLIDGSGSLLGDSETSSGGQIGNELGGELGDSILEGSGGLIENSFVGNINLPQVLVSFQSPTYLLEKEIDKNEYFCDQSKDECKVNIDLTKSFSGFVSSDYACSIVLPFESTESGKCNPNTIIFPYGESSVILKIYEKNNILNFSEKNLIIKNIQTSLSSNSSGGGGSRVQSSKEIIVQTGAFLNSDGKYVCNNELCKVNLEYKDSSNETCIWDFGGGKFIEKYIYTCNPGIVYFPSGEFNVKLKVYKNGDLSNYTQKNIIIKNVYYDEMKKYNKSPIAKISLQGVLGKDKELIGNKLICRNTLSCSVNFDGRNSFDESDLIYSWDFGNGEYDDSSNPKTVKYSPGKYIIKLKVIDNFGEQSEDIFYVEVFEKDQEVLVLNENIKKYIQLTEALPNPVGSDDDEWIKVKNASFLFINLKGLEFDDK